MLSVGEIQEGLGRLKGWALEGSDRIVKDFDFPDFKSSMSFVNDVANVAEEQEHHPSILVDSNFVRISTTTHSEHGLTGKDFSLAGAIDKLDGS